FLVEWGVDMDRVRDGSVLGRAVELWCEAVLEEQSKMKRNEELQKDHPEDSRRETRRRIVEMLVKGNADLDIPNCSGSTPLHLAADVLEVLPVVPDPDLEDYDVIPHPNSHKKAGPMAKPLLKTLLSSFNPATQTPDYNPSPRDSSGNTPLHRAVLARNL